MRSEAMYKPRTWETADIEMKALADDLGIKEYTKLEDRAGPNGFPYKIHGSFCKVILKSRANNDFKIMMNIRQLKAAIGDTQPFFLLPDKVVERPGSVAFIYPLLDRDMVDFIHQQVWSENFRNNIFNKLLAGIEFLHEKGYVHRDIKLENVCLRGSDPIIVDIDYASPSSQYHFRGTKTYMPRQVNVRTLVTCRKDITVSEKTKYFDNYALGKSMAFLLAIEHDRHKETGLIREIWSTWLKTEQTSFRAIDWKEEDLIPYTKWWKAVIMLCAWNEQAVYDTKMKFYSITDVKKELNI